MIDSMEEAVINMDNVSVGEQRDNARPTMNRSSEDVEPSTSATAENDNNLVMERNSNGSGRCLEPAAGMIFPPRQMVTPFCRPRNFDALKSEDVRLESFSQPPGWPIPFIRPEDCARTGFFFLQDDDKVQCTFCKGVVGEWEQGDDPMAEHRRHFPSCPFILGLPVGNVPLGSEEPSSQDEAAGVDVCGRFALNLSQLTLSSDQPGSVRGAQPLGRNGNEVVTSLGIKTCGNGPAHSNLVTVYARIKTFTNWPKEARQTPEMMAEAGFFYIGRRDHVKCFYCDGGLRSWEASDDPWFEHARWFSNCTYVILNKGDSFVKEVNEASSSVVSQQYLNKNPALSLPNTSGASNSNGNPTRRVSDQELRELMDTPIVQAALEMGMELAKVEDVLRREIQQSHPFLATEALLEAVLGLVLESDSDSARDENEDENLTPARRQEPCNVPNDTSNSLNIASHTGVEPGSSAEVTSSSSSKNSSGDEEAHSSTSSRSPNHNVTATPSESGTESLSTEGDISAGEGEPSDGAGSAFIEKGSSEEYDLEEEIRTLREQTLCKICMDSQVGIVFLPCGHLVSCPRCATALSNCALCRQPIKAFVRTYLS